MVTRGNASYKRTRDTKKAKLTTLNESKCSFLHSDMQNIKKEFLNYCQLITCQAWFHKNFRIYSIVNTALTMKRFCGITESYFCHFSVSY